MIKHFVLWLTLSIATIAKAQTNSIESRNDSLFINGTLIPNNPPISFFDSVIGKKGKIKRVKVSDRAHGKASYDEAFIYEGGINIRKYDYDSLHLRIGVKLRETRYEKRDKTFSGLYSGRVIVDGIDLTALQSDDEILSAGYVPFSVNVGEIKVLLAYEKGRTRKTFISIQPDSYTNLPVQIGIHRNYSTRPK